MPLAAVLQILHDTKESVPKALASKGSINRPKLKIPTKKDFGSLQKIKESDLTDEFLGYFSLLATYCVLANIGDRKDGPKRLVNIMPRTDFSAQYNEFVEPKLKEQLKDRSLYDIVKAISSSGHGLAKETFKWDTDMRTDIDDDWDGKAGDLNSGNLEVGQFLNYLQGEDPATKKSLPQKDLVELMDKALRHGQVGALGDTMENMLDTENPVPIFEFRDLKPTFGSALIGSIKSYEDKTIEYHRQFAKDDTVDNKPSKGKSLSIGMRSRVLGRGSSATVVIAWEFYTISVGRAVGKCGESDDNKYGPRWGSSDPKLPSDLAFDSPP